ncbi:MAG: carbohydrate ABC transporter permease [Thermobacillus sp.]|uniref:ABC-type sugar transport system, permease component n=1 Tax=Thermobacillus composti (strain DSM 18247 / JCM 13945 / KWC4) TaxID=717605 RepID=L0EFC6_THECK|nr:MULTISPECIES: carbohydrate ABC transporter permease [Thermobacillus]AGA58381.1 ABC-type sugar transport system, permease component [Thermobacillus composti KWC4]REK54767.1 MAG: carbohydrate ABC transporter permease [Thermobacillus sp.]
MDAKLLKNEAIVLRYQRVRNKSMAWLWSIFRLVLIIGIGFIIIRPILTQISVAFKSPEDIYNPTIYLVPVHFTMENVKYAMDILNYWPLLQNTLLFVIVTTIVSAASCALAGYGFARFKFPGSNVLFALVVLTILIPASTLMVPMYLHFRNFDVLGLVTLFTGKEGVNLLNTYWPSIITSALGVGLKSGLYIYIFRQFFRGLPKEIEEAALIDGAGGIRTFLTIMLPNAIPPIITVMLFAFVWQYNDTFYASLFMSNSELMANAVAALPANVNKFLPELLGLVGTEARADPNHVAMIVDTGILMAIAPLIIMYLFVQRYFVESVERTGVVG